MRPPRDGTEPDRHPAGALDLSERRRDAEVPAAVHRRIVWLHARSVATHFEAGYADSGREDVLLRHRRYETVTM